MIENTEYIRDWAIGACFANNRTNKNDTSQIAVSLEEIDIKSDFFEDLEEERLNTPIGRRSTYNTEAKIAATTTGMQIFP